MVCRGGSPVVSILGPQVNSKCRHEEKGNDIRNCAFDRRGSAADWRDSKLPHSKSWGYGPSGILGLVAVVVVVLLVMERI
jgi:hypothetical protein